MSEVTHKANIMELFESNYVLKTFNLLPFLFYTLATINTFHIFSNLSHHKMGFRFSFLKFILETKSRFTLYWPTSVVTSKQSRNLSFVNGRCFSFSILINP